MKIASKKFVKAALATLLATLGFASCSKPDDDPVNPEPWGIPGVYAYGTPPASYQESLTTDIFD